MKALWLILAVFSLSSILGPQLAYAGGQQAHMDACDHDMTGAADCCGDPDMSAAACAQLCNAMAVDPLFVIRADIGRAMSSDLEGRPLESLDEEPPAPPPRLVIV